MLDFNNSNINLENIGLPKMVTDPPIPYSVFKMMGEEGKHKEMFELGEKQIKLLAEQNEQLKENFNKLEDLYKIKEQELSETEKEAKKIKRYNRWMMFFTILAVLISIFALFVAIAAWLFPNVLGGAS
jgi:hypothetical protein